MSQEKSAGAGLPTLSKSTIWMINFGVLGVQTAFTLQSSQMSLNTEESEVNHPDCAL